MPPALVARLPPIEQISKLDGSGGYQRSCALAAAFSSALRRPGWTTATIASRSTVTARMRSVDTVLAPSIAALPPDRPVPAPRGTTGMLWAWATRNVACTSAVQVARTRASGVPGATVVARSNR
jgi:hypothetical protein